ncbi:MAG: hypothetical protein HC836_03505 [Richelia sp. RM2_1_2]|nr:hypothetical protein [Richelia sp. SM2_1_7]NJM18964.1 hypothetical protein [Richelia sp. SM1_7_0]NJN07402.1 hypothetical protein [Richelia sp. RM1_1_1]NJO26798.1 hypothetical protein [Richelia sp. SL_2_1]NJO57473.1 hypothetical protein [Richelia sp. RM2_1_2]NJS17128.1 hypothetical protein [Nostocaceae cyanobacterium CSU_2_110]
MPTEEQLKCLYTITCQLTFVMLQPIHLVYLDQRTLNVYILAGEDENIEFEITIDGEVF